MQGLRHRYILHDIANRSNSDEPGKSPPAFRQDIIARTGGNEPAAHRNGYRVKDHEKEGEVNALHPLLIFTRIFPVLYNGIGFIHCLGDLELHDLTRAQGR